MQPPCPVDYKPRYATAYRNRIEDVSNPAIPSLSTDRFLRLKQVAILLDCHPVTVRRWIHRGDLLAFKHGQTIRIKLSDLHAFLQKGLRKYPAKP
ncbi:MAG TPA: helix-turn-helix domain-containing protein [Bryobacteraceae bacterium]|nr:helix-turn-helix domain-containing protein [Bryobacteraceae bacterium]